jgi:excisionase family DNA binding protein
MSKGDLPLGLLSISNVSQRSNLGRTKIYDLIRTKQLPIVKCGRRTLVRTSDFEAFIAGLTDGKTSEVENG